MKKYKRNNLLKSIVIGATILSIGFSTYVKPSHVSAKELPSSSMSVDALGKKKYKDILKESLKELVKEGVLTEEKADNVLSFVKEKRENKYNKENEENKENKENKERYMNIFDEMVERKIITKEEAEAIRNKKIDKKIDFRREKIAENLDNLVKDKTITKEQKDKFLEKLDKKNKEGKELHKKLINMSHEERREYLEKNKLNRKSILDEMVKEKSITEGQAEAIKKAMPMPHRDKEKGKCDKGCKN